jgi:hypothetical protein
VIQRSLSRCNFRPEVSARQSVPAPNSYVPGYLENLPIQRPWLRPEQVSKLTMRQVKVLTMSRLWAEERERAFIVFCRLKPNSTKQYAACLSEGNWGPSQTRQPHKAVAIISISRAPNGEYFNKR